MLFDAGNLPHQVPVRIPDLQNQPPAPFRNTPLPGNERQWFFSRIQYGRTARACDEAFDDALQVQQIGHALEAYHAAWRRGLPLADNERYG